MIENIVKIKSSLITEAVSYLCKKAAYFLPEDIYEAIKELSGQDIDEILLNASIAAQTQRPICQDTGIVVVFLEIGKDVHIEGDLPQTAVNKGVEKAYTEGFLRKSVVQEPIFNRENTRTNAPAVIHTEIVPGNTIKITIAPKGAGSENKSAVKMLTPADGEQGIIDFVIETVKRAGMSSCPPLYVGIGVGGTMEYAGILAKKALLQKVTPSGGFRLRLFEALKKTGIKVFAVNVETYPCHIASLPVAVNLNCHASRHAEITLDENTVIPQKLEAEYQIPAKEIDYSGYKIISLPLKKEDIESLKAGDKVLLTGEIYTARDAAHKKFIEALEQGESLPVDLKDQIIYYTGPCPAIEGEVIGPAGPTTSGRMDKYTPTLLELGLKGMIGKGERSPEVIESIKQNKAVYFTATGGVACLLARQIKTSQVVAYPELGAEAVYRLEVQDFPVTVCIDSFGNKM